jgi:ABC-type transport system involved in cytochrome c biogenesis ATPase subunit
MLKSLVIRNLTVFSAADLHFGRNMNVIIGENGVGKTHLLKILYAVTSTLAASEKKLGGSAPTKSYLQSAVAGRLRDVFKPDELGRLVRRRAGRNRCEIDCAFDDSVFDMAFSLHTASKSEVGIEKVPTTWLDQMPAYLPTHDLLNLYPGFVSLYELNRLPIEVMWRDTCILLGAPLAKGAREKSVRTLLDPLEITMGGSIELDGERFYLRSKSGRIEMNLLAEGYRKIAMLARLIANGSLQDKSILFWDEPEANLNPRLIRLLARTILQIGQSGIQIFIATHSLFLMRELYILQAQEFADLDTRYFGLHAGDDAVNVTLADNMDEIGNIAALDEDLMQSDRYVNLEMNVPANGGDTHGEE